MKRSLLFTAALLATLPVTAMAHKQWLLPSSTSVTGNDAWVTVDAAVSNDLYYPDFVPVKLDALSITAPDGSSQQPQHAATLKSRSVFDVELSQSGSYRIASLNHGLSAHWGDPQAAKGDKSGASGRLRNVSPEELDAKIPKNAQNLEISENLARVETFVTHGAPSELKSSGKGLELVPVTHPNDLFAGENASFTFTIDGKPAAGIEVSVVRGATRYRNEQQDAHYTTDAQGRISVSCDKPGMYWLQARSEDQNTSLPRATVRRLAYTATLEVLPQ